MSKIEIFTNVFFSKFSTLGLYQAIVANFCNIVSLQLPTQLYLSRNIESKNHAQLKHSCDQTQIGGLLRPPLYQVALKSLHAENNGIQKRAWTPFLRTDENFVRKFFELHIILNFRNLEFGEH